MKNNELLVLKMNLIGGAIDYITTQYMESKSENIQHFRNHYIGPLQNTPNKEDFLLHIAKNPVRWKVFWLRFYQCTEEH